MNIKELVRHDKGFVALPIKNIKRFQVATIAATRLGDRCWLCGVRDEIIYLAAYVDAGFATRVKDKKVVLWGDFFFLKNVVAGRILFLGHRVFFVGGAPYTNRMMPCGCRYLFALFHHADARHIEHTDFSVGDVFKDLPQTAVRLNVVIVVLPQF